MDLLGVLDAVYLALILFAYSIAAAGGLGAEPFVIRAPLPETLPPSTFFPSAIMEA